MKKLLLIFFSVVVAVTAKAVSPDTLAARLWRQAFSFPQERLYAQTDRAEYAAGDTIWMRHHVVDALTGIPSLASRYVYVELVSPTGGVVRRVRMRQDEHGAIYGYLPTATDMPSGRYMLRAYTRYMADCTPDYIFSRQLRLRNVMESSVKIASEYKGGTLRLSFADPKTGQPIHRGNVRVVSPDGEELAFTGSTDEGIKIHTADIGSRQRSLLVEVGNYSEYIPVARQRVDVQLMPEGGHLVMGQQQRVAYKAVALPEARTDVPSLSVVQNNGSIMVSMVSPDGFVPRGELWLVVHQDGAPLYVQPMNNKMVRFDRKNFRDGIAGIMLVDGNANILSERLCFVWKGSDVYSDTDAVNEADNGEKTRRLELQLPDSVTANCAVSITADGEACPDSLQDIVSALLLSQELKGYVEQPAWYFADRRRSGQLDLLMLTQGWRRYDIQKALKGDICVPATAPETSMSLSGKVTSNVTAKGRIGSSVTMSSNRGGLADATTTDREGRFRFDGFEMPDSTGYMLMTRSAKGSTNSVLRMDSLRFPGVPKAFPLEYGAAGNDSGEDLQKAADRVAMAHGGRIMFLPEVEVVAKRVPKTEYEAMAKINGKSIREAELMKNGGKSLFDYLRGDMSLGFFYDARKDWFVYRNRPTLLVVDGTLWNAAATAMDSMSLYQAQKTFLMSIRTRDVLQVDILKGLSVGTLPIVSADIRSIGMNMSAIVVTTKGTTGSDNSHVALVRPLGYQRPAAFYNPVFEAPDDYDLRPTVYWNPTVLISSGKATLRFLPNGASGYRMTIEGVDNSGKIISLRKYMH